MRFFPPALVIAVLILFSVPCFGADAPDWTGNYVNDYANILSNIAQLENMLLELETNTSVEFAIVTLSMIPEDETKETYAYKIFNEWGIGKKDADNGLLLLMISNGTPGNRMWMEIGYGLEGYITDAAAGRILDKSLPYYDQGDYSQAAYIIVSEVKNSLEEKYQEGSVSGEDYEDVLFILISIFPAVIIIIFVLIALLSSRPRCPRCRSFDVVCKSLDGYMICTCRNCGNKFKRKKRSRAHYAVIAGGGFGGGGFGGGGFGGGGSGGGGAGR